VIADTYLSVNTPVPIGDAEVPGTAARIPEAGHSRARRNLAELDRQLAEQKVVSRLKVEGGWCAVLRVPATRSDEGVAIELLTAYGVSVHPGHFYGLPVRRILGC